ncbi:aminofutalosine synthase MqnE [Candidatus Desantisbacteria bacterium]|nr:aminofutalosine synthase MqnE [Candidatus Desantisbacteria bacterium]
MKHTYHQNLKCKIQVSTSYGDFQLNNNIQLINNKILSGERLSKEDGINLFKINDIYALGNLANNVKKKKTGDYVFFNVNLHINLTNVCVSRCKFCAFSRDKNDKDAYSMTADEAVRRAIDSLPLGITEVHIVSGLHPDLPFEYYVDIISRLKEKMPKIHIQAFTAVEIDYFSQISGRSIKDVLIILKNAGLGSMPGGGAEIFNSKVREKVCPKKASGEKWLEVMETAHTLGLRSNATLLYGHLESDEEIIDHLISLRNLQDKTDGFQAFIPLPFHPKNTEFENTHKRPGAFENLKMYMIARLMLDNFDHIKSFWIMVGLDIAQLSLNFGVDDLDGTVVEEKITHSAGAETEQYISKQELISLIRETGHTPVERDTLYNVIKIYKE